MTTSEKDRDILARTLWGEARGEGFDGQIAVAWTIRNRVFDGKAKSWWGEGYAEVCLKPWQFSCWNQNDPNYVYLSGAKPIPAAQLAQAQAEQGKRLALEQQIAGQDQKHSKELSDAQRNQARLLDRLATTDLRLSVLLDATDSASGCNVPAASGAVGVVHAARRAQLDPAHAQRIIAITDAGDQGLIALRACQAYVRAIAR